MKGDESGERVHLGMHMCQNVYIFMCIYILQNVHIFIVYMKQ